MKIGIASIVRDHLSSLYDADTKRISIFDVVLFFGIPLSLSLSSYFAGLSLTPEAYNVSITFFGIFIALLLNIQVAMFAIFQRKWERSGDPKVAQAQDIILSTRRLLLGELNGNISYLILVCCAALFAVLLFYIRKHTAGLGPSISVFLYAHFLLTLLMIVKRAHALFQKEYRDSPQ